MSVRDEVIRLTQELVAIPSVTDDAAQCDAVIAYIERYCRALPGVHVTIHRYNGVPSLVAAFDDQQHKGLVLNAHVDVVPARPEQFEPFVRDGRIYGRGTQDMKGAAAVYLAVLRDLAESDRRPAVAWQFVTDEEIGGDNGVRQLLENGYTTDFFIAGEPTDLRIVNRAKGGIWINVTQPGNPAHGSRPWDGENPIVPLAQGIARLLAHYPIPSEAVWQTTMTPAALHSGDAQNRVPVDGLLKIDCRYTPDEDPQRLLEIVRSCFPGATVEIANGGNPLDTDAEDQHVTALAEIVEAQIGGAAEFANEHYGTDARFYSAQGTPAICFGPHGGGLHSHEEWIDIASLEMYYEIIARLVERY